jgi:hypothetical protein
MPSLKTLPHHVVKQGNAVQRYEKQNKQRNLFEKKAFIISKKRFSEHFANHFVNHFANHFANPQKEATTLLPVL